jgi:hypothetical protein
MVTVPTNGYPALMKLPRSWSKSILLALATLYLPLVVPFAIGPLTECDHCVSSYLKLTPFVPGIALGFALGTMSRLFFVVAGAASLALLTGCTFTARRLPVRSLLVVHVPLMLLVGLEACAFAAILRA